MTRRVLLLIVVTMLLAPASALSGCQRALSGASLEPWYTSPEWPDIPEDARRVGTVERTEILVAYYGSEIHDAELRDLRARHKAAVAAGDTALAEQTNREGWRRQDFAHRQLARREPLTNIIEALAEHLPQIAADARVDAIYEQGAYDGPGTTMDVTGRLTPYLPPADHE